MKAEQRTVASMAGAVLLIALAPLIHAQMAEMSQIIEARRTLDFAETKPHRTTTPLPISW
ncbi:MAG: hypothetical protein Q8K67_07255 [Geothrix sp.]|nr:hypothetical protein [Geothrix sp.]